MGALNENHYDDDADLIHINAFNTSLDRLRRACNVESPESAVYREAMVKIANEFPLFKPLPPSTNRLPPRYIDQLIRSNNKEVIVFIDNHQGISITVLMDTSSSITLMASIGLLPNYESICHNRKT